MTRAGKHHITKIFHDSSNQQFPSDWRTKGGRSLSLCNGKSKRIGSGILLLALFLLLSSFAWRSYLSYASPQQIVQANGSLIYVLASNGLYSYNPNDQSVRTFDKVNGLSDGNITHIAYNKAARRLVIVYANQNIDLMNDAGEVTNVSAYYNTSMIVDKTIHDIYVSGRYAYLATGFGIVKLNVGNAEISDTYKLGFSVNYCYIRDNKLFAASKSAGLYSAPLTTNLADKNNWKRVGTYVEKMPEDLSALWAKVANANPGGPQYNYFGYMKFHQGKLYTCGGGYTVSTDLERPGCIQVWDGNTWTNYPSDNIAATTGVRYIDLSVLAVDPKDNSHLFAGGRTGLYEYKDNRFVKLYNSDNSPIESALADGNRNYQLIQGLGFDASGCLWLLNSQAATQSVIAYENGNFTPHKQAELMKLNGRSLGNLRSLFFDSHKHMWFVNDNWQLPSLYRYLPESDKLKAFTAFVNQDGTKLKELWNVRCAVEDKEGNIWIGTNVGPLMLEPSQIDSDNPVFQQIKVPRNDGTNYADYLLSGVDITAIAIDGANRKWFATNGNGVYLVSSNNIEEQQHFTAENSPLISNTIESIAINGITGEVFFGTDKGLCSYKSNATEASETMTQESVYAYPNPVKPDYTGPINITGLSYNVDVKITTANGTLVKEGRSNGGIFTWDGCNKNGQRVASGIYMVEVATQDGHKGVVCKIAIVR